MTIAPEALATGTWMSLSQESASAAEHSGSWFLWIVLLLALGPLIWWATVVSRRRDEADAYLLGLGLTHTYKLPPDLRPPASVWMPEVTVSDCWTGVHNGLDVAILRTEVKQGESTLVRTAVAVRRPSVSPPALPPMLGKAVTIDVESTPGWLIASMTGNVWRKAIFTALLDTLTANTPAEEQSSSHTD